MERKGRGRSFHVDGPKTEKAWEPTVESGVKHLETVIRSRAQSTGGCVKLKKSQMTEQCPWYSCSSIYLVLNSLLDWESVEKLKLRCDVVSFMFFSVRGEQNTSGSNEGRKKQARKEKIVVVEAWQNERGDKFHCSLNGKILPGRTNSMELVAAGFGGLTDEVTHANRHSWNVFNLPN